MLGLVPVVSRGRLGADRIARVSKNLLRLSVGISSGLSGQVEYKGLLGNCSQVARSIRCSEGIFKPRWWCNPSGKCFPLCGRS